MLKGKIHMLLVLGKCHPNDPYKANDVVQWVTFVQGYKLLRDDAFRIDDGGQVHPEHTYDPP